jgi:hypothetical protein
VNEDRRVVWRRMRRELKRVGIVRFLDVLAFRVYYRLRLARRDRAWEARMLHELTMRFPPVPAGTPVTRERSPNSGSAERFIRDTAPDIVLALSKHILSERIFSIAVKGTLVMHPGICPEYRNSHGCFWALANGDLGNVGMTLLKIDKGVDTGPVFGYFRYAYDEVAETHVVIQTRVILDNLDAIRDRLLDIADDRVEPIPTEGRPSAMWGQPRLISYLRWKRNARRRRHAGHRARVP